MGQRSPKPSAIAAALLFALSVFGFTLFIWKSFGGSTPLAAKGYRFSVQFGTEANNLLANASVRISGVTIGRVVATHPGPRGVRATVELESRFAPIPADARAITRSKTLLGEAYVELTPGSREGPFLPEGGVLPERNVQTAQTVDDVVGTFDRPTRRAFRRAVAGLDTALDNRGDEVNAVLGHVGPTADDLDRLAGILDRQRPAIATLVRDAGRTLDVIGRRRAAVGDIARAGSRLLRTTARRDRELAATVRALPPFVAALRTSLREVDGALTEAAPTLRELAPAAPQLRGALDGAARLAPRLERLFVHLRPAVEELQPALPALRAVIERARPLLGALDAAGRELVPVVRLVSAYRRDIIASFASVGAAAQGASGATAPDGSPQRFIRALPLVSTEQVFGYERRTPTNRFNPYRRPGDLDELAQGLDSFSCAHTANPPLTRPIGSSPPCETAEPWSFEGRVRSYPRLRRYQP